MDFFKGRKVIFATKHKKEQLVAPLLNKELQLDCFVSPELDTDLFGTFSGEIERLNNPLETARQKCIKAMELTGCDLALASEGSFGPHPGIFFVQADTEILVLIDRKNKLEISVMEVSTETNFNGTEISSRSELMDFAKEALFPSHALILRPSKESKVDIVKGITTKQELERAFDFLMEKYGKIFVETDMRAMYNPSRMKVIEKTTVKLIEKIKSCCPQCSMPGFSVTSSKSGLPCENCGLPTRSAFSHILSCTSCGYSVEKLYPDEKQFEHPMYCDFCNP